MRSTASILLATLTVFAFAGTAFAQPHRDMNDSTYLAVARCAGVAEGVGADAAPFKAALDANVGVRTGDVIDRAEEARSDAKREASHAGEDGKARYTRQLDGACHNYLQQG